MNSKKILWVFVSLTVVAGAYIAYKRFYWNKSKAIKYIKAKDTGSKEADLQSLGEGYLIARAKAIQAGRDTYQYEGLTYNTDTGKVNK